MRQWFWSLLTVKKWVLPFECSHDTVLSPCPSESRSCNTKNSVPKSRSQSFKQLKTYRWACFILCSGHVWGVFGEMASAIFDSWFLLLQQAFTSRSYIACSPRPITPTFDCITPLSLYSTLSLCLLYQVSSLTVIPRVLLFYDQTGRFRSIDCTFFRAPGHHSELGKIV